MPVIPRGRHGVGLTKPAPAFPELGSGYRGPLAGRGNRAKMHSGRYFAFRRVGVLTPEFSRVKSLVARVALPYSPSRKVRQWIGAQIKEEKADGRRRNRTPIGGSFPRNCPGEYFREVACAKRRRSCRSHSWPVVQLRTSQSGTFSRMARVASAAVAHSLFHNSVPWTSGRRVAAGGVWLSDGILPWAGCRRHIYDQRPLRMAVFPSAVGSGPTSMYSLHQARRLDPHLRSWGLGGNGNARPIVQFRSDRGSHAPGAVS